MSDEEAGPSRDEAPEEAAIAPLESSEDADEDFSPFEEVQDDFLAEPLAKIIAEDGLPMLVDNGQKSDIPPLSPKSLVCMGIFDKFVIRNVFGDVLAEFAAEEVERAPNGIWRTRRSLVMERMKLELSRTRERAKTLQVSDQIPPQDETLLVHMLSPAYQARGMGGYMNSEWVEVEPIRPPCKHYVRQITQFEYNPENDVVLRLCAARRTTEGAFMSLRDRRFAACDMRSPRELESEIGQLDAFDTRKMKEGASREYHSIFEGYGPGKPDVGNTINYDRGNPT